MPNSGRQLERHHEVTFNQNIDCFWLIDNCQSFLFYVSVVSVLVVGCCELLLVVIVYSNKEFTCVLI